MRCVRKENAFMPRHSRLRLAGLPLHIIQRGNNRAPCFLDEADHRLYLGLLSELAPIFECAIHAYVLMTNHVHMLLTPQTATGASSLMKHLGQRYVQHFNRAHDRTGSLWEGRFRSSLVDSEGYLLRCYRYIEANPVRAAMVAAPGDYRWSSYRVNALGALDPLVVPHEQYLGLGQDAMARRAAYLRIFATEMNRAELESIRQAVNGGFALGSAPFIDEVERLLGKRARRKEVRVVPPCGTSGLSPV
jgi:putative transposase